MQVPSPHDLVDIFQANLGALTKVVRDEVPPPYDRLLDHSEHMTVAMESFHGCPVNVEVIQIKVREPSYSREILLRRQSDARVVQYGIVRLNLDYLTEPAKSQVLSQQIPLGRALIQNGLFRHVELGSLWRLDANDNFRERCATETRSTFGRTALIHLNEIPAIELLEIAVNA